MMGATLTICVEVLEEQDKIARWQTLSVSRDVWPMWRTRLDELLQGAWGKAHEGLPAMLGWETGEEYDRLHDKLSPPYWSAWMEGAEFADLKSRDGTEYRLALLEGVKDSDVVVRFETTVSFRALCAMVEWLVDEERATVRVVYWYGH